ncbi:MAG: SOS response-associated peptidase [Hyphomicrobiales bacterium]
MKVKEGAAILMCGLFSLSHSSKEVGTYFDYSAEVEFPPRDYVAPGQPMGIVRNGEHKCETIREFALVRWGFVPHWAKEVRPGKPLINARSETITEKPSFRNAIKRRRCLVPASGFFEWHGDIPGRKQAYYIPCADGGLVGLAGIWEHWMGKDGSELESAAIITTVANETIAPIHNRMPVVIFPKDFDAWLNGDNTPLEDAVALLEPAPDELFAPHKVEMRRAARKKPEKPPEPKKEKNQLDLF